MSPPSPSDRVVSSRGPRRPCVGRSKPVYWQFPPLGTIAGKSLSQYGKGPKGALDGTGMCQVCGKKAATGNQITTRGLRRSTSVVWA